MKRGTFLLLLAFPLISVFPLEPEDNTIRYRLFPSDSPEFRSVPDKSELYYTGEILMVPFSSRAKNTLSCNGQKVSWAEYGDLIHFLGKDYMIKGNYQYFRLPNLNPEYNKNGMNCLIQWVTSSGVTITVISRYRI